MSGQRAPRLRACAQSCSPSREGDDAPRLAGIALAAQFFAAPNFRALIVPRESQQHEDATLPISGLSTWLTDLDPPFSSQCRPLARQSATGEAISRGRAGFAARNRHESIARDHISGTRGRERTLTAR